MQNTLKHVDLLDCTLRDGSYQVRFGFSRAQTKSMVAALEGAGLRWIEVGPGLGLGATRTGKAVSQESDRDYMAAAREGAMKARVGVFAIAGIAGPEDMELAADMGMEFIRVGVDAARFEEGAACVARARDLGLHVTAFLMKSYTLPVAELRARAHHFLDWGVDAVAIVDSAGGMTPPQVAEYVGVIRDLGGPEVAFHGHNNLQLAVGNSLAAVEAGATVIDATLRGLGRSAGNAQIEALAIALTKIGYAVAPDARALIELANRHVAPLGADHGFGEVDLVQGQAFVHSGMQGKIDRTAAKFGLDASDLVEVAGAARRGLDLTDAELEALAIELAGGPALSSAV